MRKGTKSWTLTEDYRSKWIKESKNCLLTGICFTVYNNESTEKKKVKYENSQHMVLGVQHDKVHE